MSGKCKHPFNRLAIWKDPIVVPDPDYPHDYNLVTLHLYCQACGAGDFEMRGPDAALSINYSQPKRSTKEIVEGILTINNQLIVD